jgi:hypothetical protein
VFEHNEIRDDVDERTYRLIMKSNWLKNGVLVELDDDNNPIESVEGGKIQQPVLDEDLIKIMSSKGKEGKISKKFEKFLKELTIQKKHVLGRMKKLCIDENLPTNSFLALQIKEKEFQNIEMGIVE